MNEEREHHLEFATSIPINILSFSPEHAMGFCRTTRKPHEEQADKKEPTLAIHGKVDVQHHENLYTNTESSCTAGSNAGIAPRFKALTALQQGVTFCHP